MTVLYIFVSQLGAPEAIVSRPSALLHLGKLRLKYDGTRAETRFRLSAKRTSPFKSAGGASVKSTTGSRGVRISGSNAGYTKFRGSVRVLATHSIRHFPPSLPLPCRHLVPFQLDCTLARPGHQAVDGVNPSSYFTKYLFDLYITI
jgi:hypothetical protein